MSHYSIDPYGIYVRGILAFKCQLVRMVITGSFSYVFARLHRELMSTRYYNSTLQYSTQSISSYTQEYFSNPAKNKYPSLLVKWYLS